MAHPHNRNNTPELRPRRLTKFPPRQGTYPGVLYGAMNPRVSMPMLLSMYQSGGALKLDEMVTRRYRLDELNGAIADMRAGRNIRGVIEL